MRRLFFPEEIIVLIILSFLSCRSPRPPTPPPGSATCADVCQNMTTLGCEAAKSTAEGATCETVCKNVQDSGIIKYDLECRKKAISCEAIEECEK